MDFYRRPNVWTDTPSGTMTKRAVSSKGKSEQPAFTTYLYESLTDESRFFKRSQFSNYNFSVFFQ